MKHRELLEKALSGSILSRVPIALWRHFPVDDQSPGDLAAAIVDYQKTYDFDLVKVTPSSSFCLRDWGVEDAWLGATEGTREYTRRVIHSPQDWENLTELDPYHGFLGGQLSCLEMIVNSRDIDAPVIQTIFSPLSQAKNLVGKDLLQVHIRQYPQALHAGLKLITETTIRFIEAALKTGIDGIFYAVQHGQYGLLNEQEFDSFCRYYDLQVLEAARLAWLNMLHLHGEHVMFHRVTDYPVQIMNWHDQETWPSLTEGQKYFPGLVCGGLKREQTIVLGTPASVALEAKAAITATQGRRLILGTGCVVPITAPRANLIAARRAVENF